MALCLRLWRQHTHTHTFRSYISVAESIGSAGLKHPRGAESCERQLEEKQGQARDASHSKSCPIAALKPVRFTVKLSQSSEVAMAAAGGGLVLAITGGLAAGGLALRTL